MNLGAVFPQIELAGDAAALREFAIGVEELGYDHLVMYDHVIGVSAEDRDPPLPGPYADTDPFHDPLTAFAFLAGATERIEFVTGILILPQRQTVLVARQTADIDLMSGGRLRLGVAAGYNPFESQALGTDFSTRGRRLDEQIPYLRRLWAEELIDFDGDFHRIDRANIVPRPGREIPLWCGGFSEPAFRRGARLADGFIFGYGLSEEASRSWDRVKELLAEAGRPVEGFGAQFDLHPLPEQFLSQEELIEGLHRLEAAGATHAAVNPMHRGHRDVQEHIAFFAAIKGAWDAEAR